MGLRRPALPSTVYAADGMGSPAAAAAMERWTRAVCVEAEMRSVSRDGLGSQRLTYIGAAVWRDVGQTHVQVGDSPRSDISDRGPICQRLSVPDRQKEAHRCELGSAQSRNPRRGEAGDGGGAREGLFSSHPPIACGRKTPFPCESFALEFCSNSDGR